MNKQIYLLSGLCVATVLAFQNCGKNQIANNSSQDQYSNKLAGHTEDNSGLGEIGKEMVSGTISVAAVSPASAASNMGSSRRSVASTKKAAASSTKKQSSSLTLAPEATESKEYCDVDGKTINWGADKYGDPCFASLDKIFPGGKMAAHKTVSVVSESSTWGGSVKILCSQNMQGKLEVDLYGVGQCHKGCEAEVTTGYYEVEGSKNLYFCDHQVPDGKKGEIVTGQYTGTKCHSVAGMGFELKENIKLGAAQFKCGVDKYGKLRWMNVNSGIKIAQSDESHPCEKDPSAIGCGCRGGAGSSFNWEKAETGKSACTTNISGVIMYHGQNLTLSNATAGRTGIVTLTCQAGKLGMDLDKSTCD